MLREGKRSHTTSWNSTQNGGPVNNTKITSTTTTSSHNSRHCSGGLTSCLLPSPESPTEAICSNSNSRYIDGGASSAAAAAAAAGVSATADICVMRDTNAQLTRHNAHLRRRVSELEKVCKDHMLLKSTLAQAEIDCQAAKAQVQALQRKLQALETELEYVKQRTVASNQINNDSKELNSSGMSNNQSGATTSVNATTTAAASAVSSTVTSGCCNAETDGVRVKELQAKLCELERKYDMQVVRHEKLTREMNQLRQLAPGSPLPVDQTSSSLRKMATGNALRAGNNEQQFAVFIARYSYDPVQFSPNENPEAELKLNAGDYMFVYGSADEDGFYDGELMDGKRGLIPSNFVQKVSDDELADFYSQCSSRSAAGCSSLLDEKLAAATDAILSSYGENATFEITPSVTSSSGSRLSPSVNRRSTYTAADRNNSRSPIHDITRRKLLCGGIVGTDNVDRTLDEVDETGITSPAADRLPGITVSELVPEASAALCEIGFPRELRLERQLVSSIMMAWTAPDHVPQAQIQAYQVYVDGHLRSTVRGNDRTKALVEKVDIAKVHRISVRTVTNRGQSKDQQCTLLIGKDVSMAPTEVQMLSIASTSAVVGWMPANSGLEHVVTVNSIVRTTIRPGGYRCTISGLKPVTSYTVSVQPRFGNAQQQNALTVTLNFQTLRPELPDAPVEVQVEPGPQHGTLLVMWLPVRVTERSCAAAITGYSVYVDGRRIKEMSSPTGDHILLESQDFASVYNPRQLTIRTRTTEKESNDSAPVMLTPEMVAEIRYQVTQPLATDPAAPYGPGRLSDTTGHLNDPRLQAPPGSTLSTNVSGESGFSASQLSPMELRFGPMQGPESLPNAASSAAAGTANGYAVGSDVGGNSSTSHHNQQQQLQQQQQQQALGQHGNRSSGGLGTTVGRGIGHSSALHGGKQLPQIEITRDNNGSLSDSSFDVESEENFDRRRTTGSGSSRLPNHHHGGSGGIGGRHSTSGRHHSSSGRHGIADPAAMQGQGYGRRSGANNDPQRTSRSGSGGTGHVTDPVGSGSRLFVALFDYDPASMSPNPNALNDELPFREGQIIKILRGRDPDGFYLGEANGRRGLVPSNMVSEVDENTAGGTGGAGGAAAGGGGGNRPMANHVGSNRQADLGADQSAMAARSRKDVTPPSPRRHHKHSGGKNVRNEEMVEPGNNTTSSRRSTRRHMVAVYNFDSRAQSDLSFKTGDHVVVFGDPDDEGFCYAEIDGRRGLVPVECLRDASGNAASSTGGLPSTAPGSTAHAAAGVAGGQPPGSRLPPAGQSSSNDRRGRSNNHLMGHEMTGSGGGGGGPVIDRTDRGLLPGDPASGQPGSGLRHHHDSGSSTGRPHRHRSNEADRSPHQNRMDPPSSAGVVGMTGPDRSKPGLIPGGGPEPGNRAYTGIPDGQMRQMQMQQR